jgi:hypothetical protein
MLASHAPGGKIPWSSLKPALQPRNLSVSRTAEILSAAGLLDDDRVLPLDAWTESRLAALAPGIAACARSWARALAHGTSRSRPCSPGTARIYLLRACPVLRQWSSRYNHLREVTPGDVTAAIAARHGHERRQALVALRSLMRHCKKHGLVFADPAARVRSTPQPAKTTLPLPASRLSTAAAAAATPAIRLALALAAVHALRSKAIRHLALSDIDLAGRRITVAGQSRPLDGLTRKLALEWLSYRREHWPRTSSPFLIVNSQTATSRRPVSKDWLNKPFRSLGVTLEQLRIDRQLDEALTAGPDPLHLTAVFGIAGETAIRYAAAARLLLVGAAEDQPPR